MDTPTTTQPRRDGTILISREVLLTFTGILAKSADPEVRKAAQQLYAAVKKSKNEQVLDSRGW